jgi:DNA polymerase-3 subunit epsilon
MLAARAWRKREDVMREIVLDTETTGLDPGAGHRVVEIACIELSHHLPTGRRYQTYINPERDMPADALAVHGLTAEFLASHPRFEEIAAPLLGFLGEDRLVIHNAEFDLRFLNAEFARLGFAPIPIKRATDTVALARRRYPGAPASLDALCQRFAIDTSKRTLHGAMLDAELLGQVYIELLGGRQASMELNAASGPAAQSRGTTVARPPRPHAPSDEERAAHQVLVATLNQPIWGL